MWNSIRKQISINDIFLTIYFVIQFTHLVLSMIFPLSQNDDNSGLDVVMRTATAVLAGYFISKNFPLTQTPSVSSPEKQTRYLFQTYIVAAIGLFSLCIMVAVRYSNVFTVSYTTLSQLRDLYLASVAFLMGTFSKN